MLFNKNKIKSEDFIKSKLFWTPIFSTTSSVFLIPAVSIIFNKIPSRLILPSTISLVVPSISVTIALSSFNNKFNKLLLPTFGLPTIVVVIPSFKILPFSLFFKISFILTFISLVFSLISCSVTSNISSYSG